MKVVWRQRFSPVHRRDPAVPAVIGGQAGVDAGECCRKCRSCMRDLCDSSGRRESADGAHLDAGVGGDALSQRPDADHGGVSAFGGGSVHGTNGNVGEVRAIGVLRAQRPI